MPAGWTGPVWVLVGQNRAWPDCSLAEQKERVQRNLSSRFFGGGKSAGRLPAKGEGFADQLPVTSSITWRWSVLPGELDFQLSPAFVKVLDETLDILQFLVSLR